MRLTLMALLLILASLFTERAQAERAQPTPETSWQALSAKNLLYWVERAEDEAISLPPQTAADLRAAIAARDSGRLNRAAGAAAMQLLRAYHGKCCGAKLPANWHIAPEIGDEELAARINTALATGSVNAMLQANRPAHPYYRALAAAYRAESEAQLRQLLALNLARWRSLSLPRKGRYLIVNAAAQELTLWDGRSLVDSWRVIVGKPSSPTPVFAVDVTGVVLNPWWIIPSSIAAEGIGAFVRRNPSAARAQGYIYSGGRYRQMPGDGNALGQMKLVMPNRFTVFLHDTSDRHLFALEQRALSHGCVRVDRALQFVRTLLSPDGWTEARMEEAVGAGETLTVPLSRGIPLFIAYFTAEPGRSGDIIYLPDIYDRDG